MVVPAAGDGAQREVGEVRVLLAEQGADGRGVEGGPGAGAVEISGSRAAPSGFGSVVGGCRSSGSGLVAAVWR
ncbi:hypothetical protein ACIRRH_14945 [Kitasatospora sp. NPDC101235]|uniref:hypothetical protein n=1 Tax=Kitasatospora sp. NPDC101235 TaxID=3364101 RepID=UPI00382ACA2F